MGRRTKERDPLPPLPEPEAGELAGYGWLVAMDKIARGGDERAAAAIRDSLETRPELWITKHRAGTIGHQAEEALIGLWGTDETRAVYQRTRLRADLERMRADLMQGSEDALDRLMVSRLLCCHLAVCHAEALLGQAAGDGGINARLLDWHREHVDRTNRAFLRAAESLARVRRLRGPAVAVSIGAVNVGALAGGPAAALPERDAAGEGEAIEAAYREAAPVRRG